MQAINGSTVIENMYLRRWSWGLALEIWHQQESSNDNKTFVVIQNKRAHFLQGDLKNWVGVAPAGRGRKACYKQTEIFVHSKYSVIQEIILVASKQKRIILSSLNDLWTIKREEIQKKK